MNKIKLGVFALIIGIFTSCSSSDECHECHIAYMTANGEVEVPITNSEGGEDFCGSELEEAEGPDFSYTLTEDVIIGNDTIPAGTYSEVHCEDHADHDH
tara:strand:- start:670 stop:966 length:297 start_codon:yes stop_codon:yes gene_type:complete